MEPLYKGQGKSGASLQGTGQEDVCWCGASLQGTGQAVEPLYKGQGRLWSLSTRDRARGCGASLQGTGQEDGVHVEPLYKGQGKRMLAVEPLYKGQGKRMGARVEPLYKGQGKRMGVHVEPLYKGQGKRMGVRVEPLYKGQGKRMGAGVGPLYKGQGKRMCGASLQGTGQEDVWSHSTRDRARCEDGCLCGASLERKSRGLVLVLFSLVPSPSLRAKKEGLGTRLCPVLLGRSI